MGVLWSKSCRVYKSYAGLRHNRGGCRARPGRPSMTDPARHPPRRATDRPGVPGRARSIRTRVMPGFVTAVGGVGPGPVGLLWRTRPGTPHGEWLTGRECRARPVRRPDGLKLRHRRSEFIYMIWLVLDFIY